MPKTRKSEGSRVKSEAGRGKAVSFKLHTSNLTLLRARLEGAAKVAVLGIGSDLRADDNAGVLVAHRVKERLEFRLQAGKTGPTRVNAELRTVEVFLGGTAPENLTGEIKRFAPTHLVVIDAADLNAKPGTIMLMDPDSIGGTTFCTHSLPIKVMIDYLLDSCECRVAIVGIQPKTLEVGAAMSQEVLDAVESLTAMLLDALPQP